MLLFNPALCNSTVSFQLMVKTVGWGPITRAHQWGSHKMRNKKYKMAQCMAFAGAAVAAEAACSGWIVQIMTGPHYTLTVTFAAV